MTSKAWIGIDLGGTNCRGALVYESGDLSPLAHLDTPRDSDSEQFIETLADLCHDIVEKAGTDWDAVAGLGMGVPGVISAEGKVHVSPNLTVLNDFPLKDRLSSRLERPVRIVNDANAIAWGEYRFGAGKPFHSLITMTLGTGVGGGLVLADKLWEGVDGAAGEIGHVMVEPGGRPCSCGSRGCLEQYASATGMVISAVEILDRGVSSTLNHFARSELTSKHLAQAATDGDEVALAAFSEAGRRLGQALAGVANLLNIEGVILGGGASKSLDLLRPSLNRELFSRAFDISANRLKILAGTLADSAGILGAADLAAESCRNR